MSLNALSPVGVNLKEGEGNGTARGMLGPSFPGELLSSQQNTLFLFRPKGLIIPANDLCWGR